LIFCSSNSIVVLFWLLANSRVGIVFAVCFLVVINSSAFACVAKVMQKKQKPLRKSEYRILSLFFV
jgi:hypothetical protein